MHMWPSCTGGHGHNQSVSVHPFHDLETEPDGRAAAAANFSVEPIGWDADASRPARANSLLRWALAVASINCTQVWHTVWTPADSQVRRLCSYPHRTRDPEMNTTRLNPAAGHHVHAQVTAMPHALHIHVCACMSSTAQNTNAREGYLLPCEQELAPTNDNITACDDHTACLGHTSAKSTFQTAACGSC